LKIRDWQHVKGKRRCAHLTLKGDPEKPATWGEWARWIVERGLASREKAYMTEKGGGRKEEPERTPRKKGKVLATRGHCSGERQIGKKKGDRMTQGGVGNAPRSPIEPNVRGR